MRHTAFEITKTGVWLATGSTSGGRVQLDRLLYKPLAAGVETAAVLGELVKEAGCKGSKAIAVVRRSETEVRITNLPSTDLNELPDMVRFSAARLFAVAGETWPIDFLVLPKSKNAPTSEDGAEQTSAIVMAASPSLVNQLRNTAHLAGLEVQSVMLAPVVVANAVLRSNEVDVQEDSSFLIADGYEAGTELTICEHGKVHFLRNVRTPFDLSADSIKLCSGEIKRTSMAAADSEVPAKFDQVVAIGAAPEQGDALSKLINLPVVTVDYSALVNIEKLAAADLENLKKPGWLASVLSFAEPLTARPNRPIDSREVDFLNPREAIVKQRSVPQMIAVGAGAAFLILGGLTWYFWSHSSLNSEIAQLQQQINENKTNVELSQGLINNRKEIEAFIDGRINWLDELAYISTKSLPADQALIESFNVSTLPTNGDGKIAMNVSVTEQSRGPEFEKALRGESHKITSTGWKESINKSSGYKYSGPAVVSIPAGTVTQWTPIVKPVEAKGANSATATSNEQSDAPKSPVPAPDAGDNPQQKDAEPKPEDKKEGGLNISDVESSVEAKEVQS